MQILKANARLNAAIHLPLARKHRRRIVIAANLQDIAIFLLTASVGVARSC